MVDSVCERFPDICGVQGGGNGLRGEPSGTCTSTGANMYSCDCDTWHTFSLDFNEEGCDAPFAECTCEEQCPCSSYTDHLISSMVQNIVPCITGRTYRLDTRVCVPLTACTDDQYISTAGAEDSDRVCSPISDCPDGHSVVAAATATTDTVCGSQDDFMDSKAEAYWSAIVDSVPALEGDCDAQLAGAVVLVQDMTPCVDGRTHRIGQMCLPLMICGDGQFESEAASDSADRVCSAATVCSSNQALLVESTPTADHVCVSKDAFVAGKADAHWSSVVDSAPVLEGGCEAQMAGAVGFVQDVVPCIEGRTFTVGALCIPLTVCGADEYESTPAADDSDHECAAVSTCQLIVLRQEPLIRSVARKTTGSVKRWKSILTRSLPTRIKNVEACALEWTSDRDL